MSKTPKTSAREVLPRSLNAAREAAWEMDALLEVMLDRVMPTCYETVEEKKEAMRARGTLLRMQALTSVLMSVVSDDGGHPEPLELKVYGRALEKEASHV